MTSQSQRNAAFRVAAWSALFVGVVGPGSTRPAEAVIVNGPAPTLPAPLVSAASHVGALQNPDVSTLNASAIYLGNGYVLTSVHALGAVVQPGAQRFVLGGQTYNVATAGVRLNQLGSTTVKTDLQIFKLATSPALTPLTIAASGPSIGTPVTMVGNGVNATGGRRFYDVSGVGPTFDRDAGTVWTQLPDAAGAEASGFAWDFGTESIRFGTNVTSDFFPATSGSATLVDLDVGGGLIRSFGMRFDDLAGEGVVAANDSGGAVFNANGELVGLLNALVPYQGQPASTSVFGDISTAASLPLYADQINSIVVPEPAALGTLGVAAVALLARRRRNA